jgi:hypothetical protein
VKAPGRTGASQAAEEISALAALEAPETGIDEKEVELEGEERVAKERAPDSTAKVVGRRVTSARDSIVLCTQAEKQLPFQEFVLDPPFLPALCHRLDAAGCEDYRICGWLKLTGTGNPGHRPGRCRWPTAEAGSF